MTTTLTFNLLKQISPLRLAGPIFDKELRVSSRRRRSYALRAGYIAVLCVFALSAWYSIMGISNVSTAVLGVSRLSEVGRSVTHGILSFQFLAAQVIAAVMLSSSLGDEMRTGTLSALMTTPITSFQIVLGKLLSGLWQIIGLLAISLPALAIVRAMGGVPWGMVAAGLCVTLTAALLCGMLSLWLSTYSRYPYQTISMATGVYLIVFIALPAVVVIVTLASGLSQSRVWSIIDLVSPYQAFSASLYPQWRAGMAGPGYFFSWPSHCLAMLGVTGVLLWLCSRRMRRNPWKSLGAGRGGSQRTRRLQGLPVIWKEVAGDAPRWSQGDIIVVAAAIVVCSLAVFAKVTDVPRYEIHLSDISWVFWTLALLRLALAAAGGVTREKEGGTWPLLLTTPLDDGKIVRGKANAALRRSVPILLAALAVRMCFVLCVDDSPKALITLSFALSLVSSAFFITAASVYFGVRLRTTTGAVAAAFGAYWCLHHLAGYHYNPLFRWLQYRIAYGSGSWARLQLLALGFVITVSVLDFVLGLLLLRWTRLGLRHFA